MKRNPNNLTRFEEEVHDLPEPRYYLDGVVSDDWISVTWTLQRGYDELIDDSDLKGYAFPNTHYAQVYADPVSESNARWVDLRYGDEKGIWWDETDTMYSQDMIVFPELIEDENVLIEVIELFNGLADYPVIDEDLRSEVEAEMIEDHIKSWFAHGLAKINDREDDYSVSEVYAAFEALSFYPELGYDNLYMHDDDIRQVAAWLKENVK